MDLMHDRRDIGRVIAARTMFAIAFVFTAMTAIPNAKAEERVALVIGNSSYKSSPLKNPKNDAALMAAVLKEVGFQVIELADANQKAMKRAMVKFGRRLRKSGSVGLFYYAGHGVQVDGENFLIPIGADITDESEVAVEAVSVNDFMRTMERSSSRINIAIFDACRNNPFASSSRSGTRGLARAEAPAGTIISYATAPGRVALDGDAENSPYTAALVDAIRVEGLTIESVFKHARRKVVKLTGRKQIPWDNSSLTGDFYFKKGTGQPTAGTQTSPETDKRFAELEYWESVKDTSDAGAIKGYLQRFPQGMFAELAEVKLSTLSGEAKVAAVPGGTLNQGLGGLADPGAQDGESLYQRGLKFDWGRGIPQDKAEAERHYQKAARVGHAGAMRNLGLMYEYGDGVPKDTGDAFRWYQKAAEGGDAEGMSRLAHMYAFGKGVTRNERQAVRWYQQAAGEGIAEAMHNLGVLVEAGKGTRKDPARAAKLYRSAADKGFVSAKRALAALLDEGRGAQRDPDGAARYLLEAFKAGHKGARTDLLVKPKSWSVQTRRAVQRLLKQAGAYDGPANGNFGPKTTQALMAYGAQ